jgi:hypothetical protein
MNDELAITQQDVFLAPVVSVEKALQAYQAKKDLIDKILVNGVDYGTVPGSAKPALLKPGAEKMTSFFGLAPRFIDAEVVEDWMGKDHNGEAFFFYRETCDLYRREYMIASAGGSCNSFEKKYRYRWVGEADIPTGMTKELLKARDGKISEFAFAIEKAETAGKYGKPLEYWKKFQDAIANGTARRYMRKTSKGTEMDAFEIGAMLYCIPNDEISDLANTILKMAQKRALVAATLIATGLSEYFTQDIDDFVTGEVTDVAPPTKPTPPAPTPSFIHVPYDQAKEMTAKGSNGVEKKLGEATSQQLQHLVEHSKSAEIVDAALTVLEHDFGMERPES